MTAADIRREYGYAGGRGRPPLQRFSRMRPVGAGDSAGPYLLPVPAPGRNGHPICRAGPVCPAARRSSAGRRHTWVPPYRSGASRTPAPTYCRFRQRDETGIQFVGQSLCALPHMGAARDGGGTHGCRPTGAGRRGRRPLRDAPQRVRLCGRAETSAPTHGGWGAGGQSRPPLQHG